MATTMGPIGLMINRVYCVGFSFTPSFIILGAPHVRFDVLNCAKQHWKRHTDDVVTAALSHSIRTSRTMFSSCGTIDTAAYQRGMQKLDEHQRRALQRLQVQAHWNDVRQDRYYDSARAAVCPHCKLKATNDLHPWECQGLREFRISLDDSLADLTPSNTPAHLLIGIPEKFTAGLTGHFCSHETRDEVVDGDLHKTFL